MSAATIGNKRLTIAVVVALVFAVPNDQVSADTKMNVVLVMADDLGWMDLACQGNGILQTPELDRFASQGARFTDAYAAAPVCSPTRGAIMTGLAPARIHITQHGSDGKQFWPGNRKVQPPTTNPTLPDGTVTLADTMRESGYATGFFGKWHLGRRKTDWPTHHGFDVNVGGCGFGGPPTYFDPYRIPTLPPRKKGEYLTDRLADEAIEFLKREQSNPFFLCLWTYNPHYPFEAPSDQIAKYEGKEGPGLKNPIYGGQISATDRAVGRVLDELDQLNLSDQTLVIFTSDNGGWSGATDNRPLRAGKGYLFEGGLRVPLIIRWPGVTEPGDIISTPAISMDITSTILDAAGVQADVTAKMDGVSLRPALESGELERDAIYFHYPHFAFHKANRPGSAIRSGSHKLILRYDDGEVELYDLSYDIGEQRDLAATSPQLANQLTQKLLAWLESVGAGIPTPIGESIEPSTTVVP